MNLHRFNKEQAIEFIESPAFREFLDVAYGDKIKEVKRDLLKNADLSEDRRKAYVYFLDYVTILTHRVFEAYGVDKPEWVERDYPTDG